MLIMHTEKPTDVAEYISNQAEVARPLLEAIRALIQEAVPEAEETISWNAPLYKHHGMLAGFAAYKQHIRFGVVGSEIDSVIREKLTERGYNVLERGLQIKFDQEIPMVELTQILQTKAQDNEKKQKNKK